MQIIGVVNIWIEVLLFGETPQLKNTLQPFHLHCTMLHNKERMLNSSATLLLDHRHKPRLGLEKDVLNRIYGTN